MMHSLFFLLAPNKFMALHHTDESCRMFEMYLVT